MNNLLAIVLVALLTACGGGEPPEQPSNIPLPFRLASPVSGDTETVLHLYQALYGKAPSNPQLTTFKSQIAANGAVAWVNSQAAEFNNLSNRTFAERVLNNISITPTSLNATTTFGTSLQAYNALLSGFADYLALVGVGSRGVVVAQLAKIISGLEVDTQFGVYGPAAISLNRQITVNSSYSADPKNVVEAIVPAATANAGPNQSVVAGSVVTLDGSASTAEFGKTLTFLWTLTSRPTGSTAALSGATTTRPTFTADAAGTYIASLVVNDGKVSSSASFVTVTSALTKYAGDQDGTVTDITTGLTWMRCSMGQTWSGATCSGTASTYTFNQANALTGAVTFSGKNDWRLPNIRELLTIVDWSAYWPAVNVSAFPNVPLSRFWSATTNGIPNAAFTDMAWSVNFANGHTYASTNKQDANNVRLVRGADSSTLMRISPRSTDYVNHLNGTVTHTPTGLIWQICPIGQVWTGTNCSGTAVAMTLDAARLLTSDLAGFTDWRLPKVDELISLKDFGTSYPTINNTVFPDLRPGNFWSSTPTADPNPSNAGFAWEVNFAGGYGVVVASNNISSFVRLVRR